MWTSTHQASLSITSSRSLLKLMSIEFLKPSNHLILWHPFLLPTSNFTSIRVFSNEEVLHIKSPNYWSFSFSISPFNEYSELIAFRMDWVDLLAVQKTQESSSTTQLKINYSALSFVYSPTLTSIDDYWKNHSFEYTDLCWWSNVSLYNMLSRLVIAFLPTSKGLKSKVHHCFHCLTIILSWSDGTRWHDFSFLNVEL